MGEVEITVRCQHGATRAIRDCCFSGPVSRDQNRAAHGNISVTDECIACGARRGRLVNGLHEEIGEWGPSRATREGDARRLEGDARRQVASVLPLTLARAGASVILYLDSDGYIVSDASEADTLAAARSAPTWLAAAQRARRAVLAARDARAEVS